jgi:N-acetylglucosamine-6-phosphate deacetylase
MIAYTAARLFTPSARLEQPWMTVEDGRVAQLGAKTSAAIPSAGPVIDLGDASIAPAFIDLHIHGAAGYDTMEADSAGRSAMEKFLGGRGVGAYFPTTVTASLEPTLGALERWAEAIEQAEHGGEAGAATPLGIHLEGPFLSHARRGVHPEQDLLRPSLETFERFWQAARGKIRLMTVAPELESAEILIREAAARGVCVSLGHSDSGLVSARRGVAAGARHATHTFNAMRPMGHRDPGLLAEVLGNPLLTADIIADGVHVDPAVVALFLKLKGLDGAVLITDAIAATGRPDGRYRLGPLEVEVAAGRCTSQGKLAGSVLTMEQAVRNIMTFGRMTLGDAVRLATLNPARVVGLEKQRGVLAPGAVADFVVLDDAGKVQRTFLRGVETRV